MEPGWTSYHLEQKRKGKEDTIGILLLKPKGPVGVAKEFRNYCLENNIKILEEKKILLSREAVIALYPKIFSFSEDDLKFGVSWKQQTFNYLSQGLSSCFLVEGIDIANKLSSYKYELRKRYGKITHPQTVLSSGDFLKSVISNIVHVIDEDELQNGLWLLFNEN